MGFELENSTERVDLENVSDNKKYLEISMSQEFNAMSFWTGILRLIFFIILRVNEYS